MTPGTSHGMLAMTGTWASWCRNCVSLASAYRSCSVSCALPFSARFTRLSTAQRGLYMADVVLAAVTTALLVGPVAYHRLLFRRHQKERLVRAANAMAICGLTTVALAITGAVLLIASFVVHGAAAIVITACVFCLFAGLWILVPLARRERVDRDRASGGPDS